MWWEKRGGEEDSWTARVERISSVPIGLQDARWEGRQFRRATPTVDVHLFSVLELVDGIEGERNGYNFFLQKF